MTYYPITREELEVYLPKFNPLCDLQLGEWVLVTPRRRSALVEPLIRMVEEKGLKPRYPFLDTFHSFSASSSESLMATSDSLPELKKKESFVNPSCVFPSLTDSFKKYSLRHRYPLSHGKQQSEVEDETVLYLNYRALILTPCAPNVFGGSDFLEGLDKETGRIVFFNWKTGEVRTDAAALQPNQVPDWAEEVVEKAEEELMHWRRHQCHVSQVDADNELAVRNDSDAPPLRKSRRG